ncbi:MAG: ABC transporter ATP-binding protein [Candidatus Aminicenantes bacterium]|nr:ABC transporter ATP-binding protein [Candidatus Aminicenantes bacterium]
MSHQAIAIKGLSKTYGKASQAVQAVRDLNLQVEAGQVYGFLGPNGAGKSTTIRVLMDLIRPTAGEAFLFGKPTGSLESRKRVGALVEGADFYPFMSAWDNLVVLDRTAGSYHPDRIAGLIESVGLSQKARQPVGGFSTGMKQRLGLAAALLNDPELLILDEPTNGLDPAGIQEMRVFIREQAHTHDKTVFLSSHMLNEVEQVCDRVAIINKGILLREGPVETLLEDEVGQMRLQVRPVYKARQVIVARWPDALVPPERDDSDWLTLSLNPDQAPLVVNELVQSGVQIFQLVQKRQSLEEFFIAVTAQARERADA